MLCYLLRVIGELIIISTTGSAVNSVTAKGQQKGSLYTTCSDAVSIAL